MIGRSATGRQPWAAGGAGGGRRWPHLGERGVTSGRRHGAFCVRIMRIIRAYPSTPSTLVVDPRAAPPYPRTTPQNDAHLPRSRLHGRCRRREAGADRGDQSPLRWPRARPGERGDIGGIPLRPCDALTAPHRSACATEGEGSTASRPAPSVPLARRGRGQEAAG